MHLRALALAASLLLLLGAATRASAGDAKGTLTHKDRTVALKYAYLVKGPDAVDPSMKIRRLILSQIDLGAKLEACKTMSCTDGSVTEGMTVDLDAGPRLNYWMAIRDQMVQHSDTAKPEVLKATADTPERLAGKLTLDGTASGGPKVDVEFDAPLVKQFDAAN